MRHNRKKGTGRVPELFVTEAHRIYMADDTKTIRAVAASYGYSVDAMTQAFRDRGLAVKVDQHAKSRAAKAAKAAAERGE